ncbi:cysteine protease [bacterium]|nr:cysteine protease [bacterium]PIV81785.1 MAG: cysteine protease [bacterium CG17_big_fil_post_rev_8_21_14_2_50_64_8]PJA76432.1 MAG: cysteine protease [bacterium CG_4_9_14_3_um_filter_65_15]
MAPSAMKGIGWLKERSDLRDLWIDIQVSPDTAKGTTAKTRPLTLKGPDGPPPAGRFGKVAASVGGLSFPYPPPQQHFSNVKWCPPIEDQLTLGSCTAHAGVGLLEYYENRTHGKHIDGSRLFLYKVTRNLLNWTGDTGAYCRTTMGAIALLGVAIEEYWPYTDRSPDFDQEPPSFVYALARNYQGLTYHRLDGVKATLPLDERIKFMISIGWPLMFGFTCYESLRAETVALTGEIPFPSASEKVIGGHAVIAVGYDDTKKIRNTRLGGRETTGAFLIRNSWGTQWGCVPPDAPEDTTRGYGWLPYEYLDSGLANDWWTLTMAEWNDAGVFGI